jgi:hypothetical protein
MFYISLHLGSNHVNKFSLLLFTPQNVVCFLVAIIVVVVGVVVASFGDVAIRVYNVVEQISF